VHENWELAQIAPFVQQLQNNPWQYTVLSPLLSHNSFCCKHRNVHVCPLMYLRFSQQRRQRTLHSEIWAPLVANHYTNILVWGSIHSIFRIKCVLIKPQISCKFNWSVVLGVICSFGLFSSPENGRQILAETSIILRKAVSHQMSGDNSL
jgi:hypothetical protein